MRPHTARRDIEIRNRQIIRLYLRGVARKRIACLLNWEPAMSYEAVKKVIQRTEDRRRMPGISRGMINALRKLHA